MDKDTEKYSREWWEKTLATGEPVTRWWRAFSRRIPANPRCKMCLGPFGGFGGRVYRIAGFGPSRKNPLMCKRCCEEAPLGGAEVDVAVLFADVRGYTALAEHPPPHEVAALMNRFYGLATDVLSHHDAIIDKFVGDGVMAFFIPGLTALGHATQCAKAAEQLLRGVGYASGEEPWLSLAVGIDAGTAFVGNVGTEETKDFTALGDVVNTASRLQAHAEAGQIVLSERMYERVPGRFSGARLVELDLKGKSEPVAARVVSLQSVVA